MGDGDGRVAGRFVFVMVMMSREIRLSSMYTSGSAGALCRGAGAVTTGAAGGSLANIRERKPPFDAGVVIAGCAAPSDARRFPPLLGGSLT